MAADAVDRGLSYHSFLQLFRDFEYWPLKREGSRVIGSRLMEVQLGWG